MLNDTNFLDITSMSKSVARQVIELQHKSAVEMRSLYRSLFTEPLPYNANNLNLRTKIAYRIQELALGGLSNETKNLLENLSQNQKGKKHNNLIAGTKIHRIWNGTVYEVEVLKDGFEYQGQRFRSLSAIANKITGTRWNGLKFFKLK